MTDDVKKLQAQVRLLIDLLKQADNLLVAHHESSLCNFDGECPVCGANGQRYPSNIFGRINDAIIICEG